MIFANPVPSAGLFLVNENDELLIAIRDIDPGKGRYNVPGGFLDVGETIEQGLAREVREELGLPAESYTPPQFLCSGTDEYEFDNEARIVLGSLFWARLDSQYTPSAQEETAAILFVPLQDVDPDSFFFPDVQAGTRKLKELWSAGKLQQ